MEDYYNIEVSKVLLVLTTIVGVLGCIFTFFLSLLIPICCYFILKNYKYYYNDDKIIIEKGVFNKSQQVVPLYRIVNITATEYIFHYGIIYIRDKQQLIILNCVKNPKKEMLKLIDKWEKSKVNNVRNEVI